MCSRLILTVLISLLLSWKKEPAIVLAKKTRAQLLTQSDWKLLSFGSDENRNGLIDPAEDCLQECQEDDSYIFWQDGTASYADNRNSCGGPGTSEFKWKLSGNDTLLDMNYIIAVIQKLTENELILRLSKGGKKDHAVSELYTFRHQPLTTNSSMIR